MSLRNKEMKKTAPFTNVFIFHPKSKTIVVASNWVVELAGEY